MKTAILSLVLMAAVLSSLTMTGCVVHERDRVVYDREHPRYYEEHHEDHHDDVHGDVHVDVRP